MDLIVEVVIVEVVVVDVVVVDVVVVDVVVVEVVVVGVVVVGVVVVVVVVTETRNQNCYLNEWAIGHYGPSGHRAIVNRDAHFLVKARRPVMARRRQPDGP